jgi:hypothetical protein
MADGSSQDGPKQIGQASQVSQVSEISQVSQASQASQVSQASQASEASQVSQASQVSEISQVDLSSQSSTVASSQAFNWLDLVTKYKIAILAIIVLIFVIILYSIFSRKPSPPSGPKEDVKIWDNPPAIGSLALSPPAEVFPSQWLAKADKAALSSWLTASQNKALAAFFEEFLSLKSQNLVEPFDLKKATARLALSLKNSISEPALAQAFGSDQSILLSAHLAALLPPFVIPPLEPEPPMPRLSALAVTASMGAIFGDLLGGRLLTFFNQPLETGILVGSALGAGAGVLACMAIARNKRLRRILLIATGAIAAIDAGGAIAKSAILPGFLGGTGSFIKRLGIYLGFFVIVLFIKPQRANNPDKWRELLASSLRSYLNSAIAASAVLLYRLDNQSKLRLKAETVDSSDLALSLVEPITKLMAQANLADNLPFSEIVRKMENAGFKLNPYIPGQKPLELIWEAKLSDSYDTYGLIQNGQIVIVEEEPIIKDGQVVKKGLVTR